MSARLLISTDEGLNLEVQLGNHPVRIGRREGSTLRSPDRRTSRQHAIIRRTDQGYELEDLASSNGTLLNGQPVQQRPLSNLDLVVCGGLQIQYLSDGDEATEPDARKMAEDVDGLRAMVRDLISEAAMLRGEVGTAREALVLAERQRDEEHDEASRLRARVTELLAQQAEAEQRLAALGADLRNERSVRMNAAVAQDLVKAQEHTQEQQRQGERQKARLLELEAQQGEQAAREAALKKEVERLTEQNHKREKREIELTQVVQPALKRVAQLTGELEKAHKALALAQAELATHKGR